MLRVATWGLMLAAGALVFWVRTLPLGLHGADQIADRRVRVQVRTRVAEGAARDRPADGEIERRVDRWIEEHQEQFAAERAALSARVKSAFRYLGPDQQEHVYLGDYDSYEWLRLARNYLGTGTTCDARVDGECWDAFANAPIGRALQLPPLHVAAIVAVHSLIQRFHPRYPLAASSFWVPVIAGTLAVVPAFLIGRRLAGPLGGLAAALLVALHPPLLQRSIGSDNDVWNVVLPLFMVWAAMAAVSAERPWRQAAWAAGAGLFAALHVATWSGWVFAYEVVLTALLGDLLLAVIYAVSRRRRGGVGERGARPDQRDTSRRWWNAPTVWRSARVVVCFYLAAGLGASAIAAEQGYWSLPVSVMQQVGSSVAAPVPSADAIWPDVFSTVSELQRTDLGMVIDSSFGAAGFAAALVGALLLVSPRTAWQRVDTAVFLAGAVLYVAVAIHPQWSAAVTLLLATLPLGVAIAFQLWHGRSVPGAALIAVVWLIAGLYASFHGIRFLLLLGPPLGIGIGVAIGRLYERAAGLIERSTVRHRVANAVLLLAFGAFLIPPVLRGYRTANSYLPAIDAAWGETLSSIRDHSAADAIVNTWWSYGYWAEYVAERRTTADGGSLRTHLPYWLGRALLSESDAESVGLLRMLNCGSDTTPLPEGRRGAYATILRTARDPATAHDMVVDLARRDRAAAAAYLTDRGFSAEERDATLAATHCTPPETVLVINSGLARDDSWLRLGQWDFRKAYIAQQVARVPRVAAIADFMTRFGYSEQEAAALYAQARGLSRDDFVVGPASRTPAVWYPCRPSESPSILRCPLGLLDTTTDRFLEEFTFDVFTPENSRIVYRGGGSGGTPGASTTIAPGALLVADSSLTAVDLPAPRYPTIGVLLDTLHWRILVGSPPLIRSTFAQLVYLDGRYAPHFEKIAERVSYAGDRIITFRVHYTGPARSQPKAR
jgi:dolichyl-diphosphooligosaccharide--protein glycosyltransferase